MSEFDENKIPNGEEPSEDRFGSDDVNNQQNASSVPPQSNGGYRPDQNPNQPYNPYNPNNGGYGQNQGVNGNGYYGQSQNNNGYYGQNTGNPYNRNANYVYYGSNRPTQPYGTPTPPYGTQNGYNINGEFKPVNSEKGRKKGVKIFVAIIIALIVLSLALTIASSKGYKKHDSGSKVEGPEITVADSEGAETVEANGELTAVGVYDKIKEASVGILVYSNYGTNALKGQGSGVIVGEGDGGKFTYIITCAHVVSDGGTVKVQLYDESQYDATVIGYDAKTDIAVLRIAKTGLSSFEIGDSEKLCVGETVYAIGNPGGVIFAGSFTNGMVSSIARPVNSQIGYEVYCIQHTAAINPGNSGGALVNSKGQLVGINSSKIASTDYEGMGFAVPSSTFVEIYNEIIKHGYVTNRPMIGINYTPAQASQTYSMLVGVKGLPAGSLVIKNITSDSSLVGTQVQVGDIITKVNGKELETADMLPDMVEKSNVGDKMTLTICHVDANYQITEFDVEITLVEDKGNSTAVEEKTTQYFNPFEYFYGQNQK